MRGIVLVSPNFFKWFAASWVSGMALFPFILIRDKQKAENSVLINHESIHIRQQLELLIIFFYVWYGLEYLIRWIATGSKMEAYRNISFEKEAYAFQHDQKYLNKRKFWSHISWL